MKRATLPAAFCMSLIGMGVAHADETVTPTADTYVKKGNKAGYGSESMIYVKNSHNGDGDNTRKGVLRFANSPMMADAASLTLHATFHDGDITVHLWGINEGNCAEAFDESTADYRTFPYFDSSDDGVDNGSACLFGGTEIAKFTVNANTDYTISNQALLDFLNADTNGVATFALTTDTSGRNGVQFGSRESGYAPSLSAERFGTVNINESFVGGEMSQSDGVTHFSAGTLEIPFAGGTSLALPIAEADMTFDAQGNLRSFNGTVGGSFSLPAQGVFGELGPLSFDAPSLSLGYGSPDDDGSPLGDLDLPFSDRGMRGKYFYLIAESGVGVSWGPLSLSAPVGGETIVVIDPNTPTLYTTSDQILDIPLGIGVSGADALAFTPLNNNGVESHLEPFDGNLCLSGAIDLPVKEDVVTATLAGDVTLAVDGDAFVNGLENGDVAQLGQWLSKLGGNGTLSLSADLGGGLTLGFDNIASSSVLYDSSKPSLAFASGINSGDVSLPSLPIAFNDKLNVSGYINGADLLHSYYQVGGSLEFPNGFLSGNSISATVKYGPAEVGLEASIKFGGFKFDVDGDVTPARARFSGSARASIDYTFNYLLGKKTVTAHFTIRGSFDSRDAKPDFTFADLDSGFSNAVGDLTNDGHIKVCIDFPSYDHIKLGRVCQNL